MNDPVAAHGETRGGCAPTRLLLIRHAQAAHPDDVRLPGPDLALTALGEAQARRLANRLRNFAPAIVYSSDAQRARQTAAIIAAACRIPWRVDSALRELEFGAWGGRTFGDIVAADSAAGDWFAHPDKSVPPGGERVSDAAERVLGALQVFAAGHVDPVAVVGHAGSLRLAVARAIGLPLSAYWRLHLDCASLSVVTWTDDGLVLERWNDTEHLEPPPNIPDAPPADRLSAGAMTIAVQHEQEGAPS